MTPGPGVLSHPAAPSVWSRPRLKGKWAGLRPWQAQYADADSIELSWLQFVTAMELPGCSATPVLELELGTRVCERLCRENCSKEIKR